MQRDQEVPVGAKLWVVDFARVERRGWKLVRDHCPQPRRAEFVEIHRLGLGVVGNRFSRLAQRRRLEVRLWAGAGGEPDAD
jgi:hypothetical protein